MGFINALSKIKVIRNFINKRANNMREVQELYKDLKSLGYKKVKVLFFDKNSAKLQGSTGSKSINVHLDFNTRAQNEVRQEFSRPVILGFNKQQTTTVAKGTMDGKVNTIRTTNRLYSNNHNNFMETVTLENQNSGNIYRRIETPQGKQYFKFNGTDFIPLFPK